jgi:hypothetical protein
MSAGAHRGLLGVSLNDSNNTGLGWIVTRGWITHDIGRERCSIAPFLAKATEEKGIPVAIKKFAH